MLRQTACSLNTHTGPDTHVIACFAIGSVLTSSLETRKWQLTGVYRSALCGHPMSARTDNWNGGIYTSRSYRPQGALIAMW